MKVTAYRLAGLLGLAASCHVPLSMAAPNTCEYSGPAGMNFTLDVRTLYVPQDAPIGRAIGPATQFVRASSNGGSVLCENDSTATLLFNAQTTVPFVQSALPGFGPHSATHTVLQTNVPGVGARIKLRFPFDNSASNSFVPDTGDPTVPFSATHQRAMGATPLRFSVMESDVTLIKTGDIAPGPQTLSGELFSGYFSGISDKAFSAGIIGTVIQAHCGSNRVSHDPVPLGDWDIADFSAPGYATTAVPFNITLSSCVADPGDVNIAMVNIRFEGSGGSLPVTPPIPGVFSLTPDSVAEGIGIQIMKADGSTPLELNTEIPLQKVIAGDTVLDFTARFYQTAAPADVRPGSAKGALKFTLTYN
ncbi:fimbrial protein [Pseudomonas sp. LB3P81]